MVKLLMEDDLNRRLVALLQQDGRMSHAELAERLGVSRPTIIDRVKRLEADGVLGGYAARVTPAAVNKPTVAFVAVRYKDNNEAIEQRFIKALERRGIPYTDTTKNSVGKVTRAMALLNLTYAAGLE
jgi:Lrp/AsnC family leucine-responsive transcriptional regulator